MREADPQRADLAPGRPTGYVLPLFRERRHTLDPFQESLPSRGEFRTMRHPTKQCGADFRLEILDLLAEGRLTDPDFRSRACEVPLLGDREEIADMAELHNHLQNRSCMPESYIGMPAPRHPSFMRTKGTLT